MDVAGACLAFLFLFVIITTGFGLPAQGIRHQPEILRTIRAFRSNILHAPDDSIIPGTLRGVLDTRDQSSRPPAVNWTTFNFIEQPHACNPSSLLPLQNITTQSPRRADQPAENRVLRQADMNPINRYSPAAWQASLLAGTRRRRSRQETVQQYLRPAVILRRISRNSSEYTPERLPRGRNL